MFLPPPPQTASRDTGCAGAGNSSGSGAGSAGGETPTGAKTGGAVKSTAGVRDAALAVSAVFVAFV